nr:ribosomal protein L10 [Ceratophyllum demersum]
MYSDPYRLRRTILQRESLLRVSGEKRSPDIPISFHSSGSTSNQWRKLKNPWFPGRTPFRPSCGTGRNPRFFAQLAHSAGPTCIYFLAEEASDKSEFLPSWDGMDQDLLPLYGQNRSSFVFHMDLEKCADEEELETSLFHLHLPCSYLSFVCFRDVFRRKAISLILAPMTKGKPQPPHDLQKGK